MSKMKEYDICVVGGCVQDVVTYSERFPKPGESIRGHDFKLNYGGKGADQAVCAARLGAKVALIGMVGNDMFGKRMIENFKDENLNTDHMYMTDESPTGTANIYVDDSGENCLIVCFGANLKLTSNHVQNAENIIAASNVVVCQFEINLEVTLEALKIAKKHNVQTILNPAPGLSTFNPEILQYVDIICPNETEAEIITGYTVNSPEDAETTADVLRSRGAKEVVITLGSKGCYFKQNEDPIQHVMAPVVKAVDTVGAGDCFVGSLAYFFSRHPKLPLKEKLNRVNQIASMSVQRQGTQPSYPRRSELSEELFA